MGKKIIVAINITHKVRWLDEASQAVKPIFGLTEEGKIKGNKAKPTVRIMPAILSESNKLQSVSEEGSIVHRDRESRQFQQDFADWSDEYDDIEVDDDDIEELDVYDMEDLED